MKKLASITVFLFTYSCAQASDMATEYEVKTAIKILLANQHVQLSKSELCKPTGLDKTIGDLIAKTLSYTITDKDHKTQLSTQCEHTDIKGQKLLDCEMSIYMPTREGASYSVRFTINPVTKLLVEDSLRCF